MPAARTGRGETPQRDQAYRALRRLLILQKVTEGVRLREPEWAAKLGVNRMALREAFARLEAEGLIQRGPAPGYFVPRLTEQDISEVLAVRTVLECAAVDAMCVAGLTSHRALRPLRDACDDLASMIHKHYALGAIEADRRFHEALVDLAGNRRLAMIYHRAPLPMIHSQTVGPTYWTDLCQRTLSEHRQIVAAIEAGKATAARALVRKHLKRRPVIPLSD